MKRNYFSSKQSKTLIGGNVYYKFVVILSLIILLANHLTAQPLAENKSKFVGNIISNGNDIRSNFSNYWNQVTAENAGKWGSVEGSAGNYNWTQLDKIYNYAINKNFPYKHHCLVWGNQQPNFLESLDSAAQYQEVENWIKETGSKYTEADMCDVVNEPLHAPPVYMDALGGDGETGWDWVIKSFELARQYWSPDTKLLINEYNILNSGTATDNYLEIIDLLNDRGLIDGIGIQCHNYEVNSSGATLNTLRTNLQKLTATGLPVYISEFDINEADDQIQLEKYQSIFPLLYEQEGVAGITLWGYVQYDIWQADAYLLTERYVERPAMEWLRTYLASPFSPIPISPDRIENVPLNPILIWHRSEAALTYNIQLATSKEFTTIVIDTTVADTLLQLDSLEADMVYYWRIAASNDEGTSLFSDYAYFVTEVPVGVEDKKEIPNEFVLSQNYPNPFNPTTNIEYSLPRVSKVSLKIYDVLGREIRTLINDVKSPGKYTVTFNAQNLPSGVYFYHLEAGSFNETKRLMLTK